MNHGYDIAGDDTRRRKVPRTVRDPLVMNTNLTITIPVLAAVCFTLAALLFRSQKALANMHPLIVRINEVGRAEAIDQLPGRW